MGAGPLSGAYTQSDNGEDVFGCPRSRNAHIERKKSKYDYILDSCPSDEQVAAIEAKVNEVITEGLPVTIEFMTSEQAAGIVDLSKLPDDALKILRIVRIGERLMSEHPQVWQFGPVFPRAYNKLRKDAESGQAEYEAMKKDNPAMVDFLDSQFHWFGRMTASAASAPHVAAGTPWPRTMSESLLCQELSEIVREVLEEDLGDFS